MVPVVIVTAFLGGCETITTLPADPTDEIDLVSITISPESTATGPGGTVQFNAYGLTAAGDTTSPQVTYTATGGTISADGLFTAGSEPGAFQVVATHGQTGLTDAADVTVTVTQGPAIDLSPTTLAFATAEGGSPASKTFTVTNAGSGTLNWSASENEGWVQNLTPNSGQLGAGLSQNVTVAINSASLNAGSYAGQITVTGDADNSPQTVDVELTVTQGPAIDLSPATLVFSTVEGGNPSSKTFRVTNAGIGTLNWSASENEGWIDNLSPSSGQLGANQSQDVTVSIASSSLNPNSYDGQITVTGNADNSPQTVDVELTVNAPPPPPGGTAEVQPTVETDPSHHSGDTADDMAIWIHPTDPSLSLVIGDDKEGGLMVWEMDGDEVQYIDANNYNNLDLRYNFPLAGQFNGGASHQTVALVGVGDEGGQEIDFFKVNPTARRLESAGSIDLGSYVPYGACMYYSMSSGKYYFFANDKNGVVQQWELRDGGGGEVTGTMVREFDVGRQTEGCVADDYLGYLYVGEEDVGVWKYGAEANDGNSRTQVDHTGSGGNLVADVEGMSLYYDGTSTGYLIVSSQGESRIAIYTREGDNAFLGKIEVVSNGSIDEANRTDGLDVTNFPLGSGFAQGLLTVHDGNNDGASATNVKYVPWASVAAALGLSVNTTHDPRTVGQ
jgi:3-phytase